MSFIPSSASIYPTRKKNWLIRLEWSLHQKLDLWLQALLVSAFQVGKIAVKYTVEELAVSFLSALETTDSI